MNHPEKTEPEKQETTTMRKATPKLGGAPVTVFAPEVGDLDRTVLDELFPATGGFYGLDVESTSLTKREQFDPDFRVRLVQIATPTAAVVFRMDDPAQREAAVAVLANEANEFCSHSQVDVVAVHEYLGVDITGRNLDTLWLAWMAQEEDSLAGRDLKALATKAGMPELSGADHKLDEEFLRLYLVAHPEQGKKPVGADNLQAWGWNNIPTDNGWYLVYAGLDAIAVRRVATFLLGQVDAPEHLLKAERFLATQATHIRIRGCVVDTQALERVSESTAEIVEDVAERLAFLTDGCGEKGAGLKPTQLEKLIAFWEAHGATWEGHPKTTKGRPKMDKLSGGRELLLLQPMDEDGLAAAQAYLEYAKVLNRKVKTQEIKNSMVVGADGLTRIHPKLLSIGTVTARMSSQMPNMQNFAKRDWEMKGLLLPEPVHSLLSCDFSQVELRTLAALSQDPALIELIRTSKDFLQDIADQIGVERQTAKTGVYATMYGATAKKLAVTLGCSLSEAQEFIDNFWGSYPAAGALKQMSLEWRSITTISGRVIPASAKGSHANLNYLIQSSARDLLVGAWLRFAAIGPDRAAMVWMPVHDELVLMSPDSLLERTIADVESVMNFDLMGVPIAAQAVVLRDEHGVGRWLPSDYVEKLKTKEAS